MSSSHTSISKDFLAFLEERNSGSRSTSTRDTTERLIMGLDLSLTATGLVLLTRGTVRHLLIKTKPLTALPKKADGNPLWNGIFHGTNEDRNAYIAISIMELWVEHAPDLVLIEGYSFGSKGSALSALHELGGVVKNYLWIADALWLPISPNTNKSYATGNHQAKKPEMIARAQKLWSGCPDEDNVADAFHLARYGLRKFAQLVEAA